MTCRCVVGERGGEGCAFGIGEGRGGGVHSV